MNDKVKLAGYTFLNLRLASFLIPYIGVAWSFGFPGWMAWLGGILLVFAACGEAFTAYAHGTAALLTEQMHAQAEREVFDIMLGEAERFANGEQEDAPEEGNEGEAPAFPG